MRKWRIFLCTGLIFAMLPALLWARSVLPVRSREYIAKKYAGWNGVLRVWFCCEWNCSPGFTGWLNGCAAAFEKENSGVYVEIEPVSPDVIRTMTDSGLNLPDAVIFSNGLMDSPAGLLPLDSGTYLRAPLAAAGCGRAIPVAMGGYILVKSQEDPFLISMPQDGAFNYSAALIALSENSGTDIEVPELELDLGLPASAAAQKFFLNRNSRALDDFINGDADAVLTDQSGLSHLNDLRSAGRGPEWMAEESGRYAFTDQLLMCAVVQSSRPDAESREELSARFARSLLSEENQQKLSASGAFSVLTERIYTDTFAFAALERLLISRTLIVPKCFGVQKTDLSPLANRVANGTIAPADAAEQLASAYAGGFAASGPNVTQERTEAQGK